MLGLELGLGDGFGVYGGFLGFGNVTMTAVIYRVTFWRRGIGYMGQERVEYGSQVTFLLRMGSW